MELKFCAREDLLVNLKPGVTLGIGQMIPRVNREPDGNGGYPASEKPFCCDSESAIGKYLVRRMVRAKKQPPLWPADEQTAKACGVKYQPIEFKDGEWLPKAPEPPKQVKQQSKPARD